MATGKNNNIMKTNTLFRTFLKAVSAVVLVATLLAACNKTEEPDTPARINSIVYGDDTLRIINAAMDFGDGNYQYQFVVSDTFYFMMASTQAPNSGSLPIIDAEAYEMGTPGYYACLFLKGDMCQLVSGTIDMSIGANGEYLFTLVGTTEEGQAVDIYYKGAVIDLTRPTGTGSISLKGETFPVELAIATQRQGGYELNVSSLDDNYIFEIDGIAPIANGEYILTDATDLAANQYNLYYDVESVKVSDFGSCYNGEMTCTVSSGIYTITFSGECIDSEGEYAVPISGTYTGSIHLVNMSKAPARSAKKGAILSRLL